MLWTDKDSNNLLRIANALETIAGKKTFIPSDSKLKIEEVEDNDEEEKKIIETRDEKLSEIFTNNEGNHLWEETNLAEIADELNDE